MQAIVGLYNTGGTTSIADIGLVCLLHEGVYIVFVEPKSVGRSNVVTDLLLIIDVAHGANEEVPVSTLALLVCSRMPHIEPVKANLWLDKIVWKEVGHAGAGV